MDLIEKMDKTKRIKVVLFAYALFTNVYLLIRILNYNKGFLTDHADYFLYAIKMLICVLGVVTIRKNMMEKYRTILPIMELMVAFSAWEFLVSLLITDPQYALALTLFLIPVAANIILDFFFYLELCNSNKDRRIWIAIYCVLAVFILTSIMRSGTLFLVAVAMITRLAMALIYIQISSNSLAQENEKDDKHSIWNKLANKKINRKIKIALIGVYAFILCAFAFSCLYKPSGKYVLTSEDGSVSVRSTSDYLIDVYYFANRHEKEAAEYKQYDIENCYAQLEDISPYRRTGFERTWCGLIDVKTGEVTSARYKGYLSYDDNGIAWDYNGHFIDLKGDTVITMPRAVTAKRSTMTTVFNSIYAFVKGGGLDHTELSHYRDLYDLLFADRDFSGRWHDWDGQFFKFERNFGSFDVTEDDDINDRLYFWNHAAVFYSEVKGCYGIVNDRGEILVKPCFYSYRIPGPNVLVAHTHGEGNLNVFTFDGKQIFSMDNTIHTIRYEDEYKLLWGDVGSFTINEYANQSAVIDYDGNIIYSGITGVRYATDDEIIIKKVEDGDVVEIAIDYGGNELYRVTD